MANEIAIKFDEDGALEELFARRLSYKELKSCIEALMLEFLEVMVEEALKSGDRDDLRKLQDIIKGERMYYEQKCYENGSNFERALKAIRESMLSFERNYGNKNIEDEIKSKLRGKTSKLNTGNMVISLKVSEIVFKLIDDVRKSLNLKSGLKSDVLGSVFKALLSDDPDGFVRETARRYHNGAMR